MTMPWPWLNKGLFAGRQLLTALEKGLQRLGHIKLMARHGPALGPNGLVIIDSCANDSLDLAHSTSFPHSTLTADVAAVAAAARFVLLAFAY